MIKVLDCTLRDGGYVNNWEFGFENIQYIVSHLSSAKLDYIECGFLKDVKYNHDKTVFSNIEQLQRLSTGKNLCLMINYGEYPIENIPQNNEIILRIAFKKHELSPALEYCKELKLRGSNIFINPMVTDSYTEDELIDLINGVNEIKPIAFTIADTLGEMTSTEIEKLFKTIDAHLDKDIALCFHSHNNIQMSFANTQKLIDLCKTRDLIIDSSIFGMGRGAGNLCTELITQRLGGYDVSEIMTVSREYIMPIYEKYSWGCSAESYLGAINHCHPNYAKYLSEKNIPTEDMIRIFQSIPDDKKAIFDKELIEKLVIFNQNL